MMFLAGGTRKHALFKPRARADAIAHTFVQWTQNPMKQSFFILWEYCQHLGKHFDRSDFLLQYCSWPPE